MPTSQSALVLPWPIGAHWSFSIRNAPRLHYCVMSSFQKSMWLRSLSIAILASGFWAAWAFFINREVIEQGVRAAVTQGSFSFAMTFVFVALVEWNYARGGTKFGLYLRTTLVPAGSIAFLLPLTHWVRNTPNIVETVTPPILLAAAYCLVFVYGREKTTGT